MKLSPAQQTAVLKLSERYAHGRHHPKDAYDSRTLGSLRTKGYVEDYFHSQFLHGAVRLTDSGKEIAKGLK